MAAQISNLVHERQDRVVRAHGSTVRLRVMAGATAVEGWPGPSRPSHRRLLAILLLDDRASTLDSLLERFWTGPLPRSARGVIHTHVYALRRMLPPGLVVTEHDGYRLDTTSAAVDRNEFVESVRQAHAAVRSRRWDVAVDHADAALALWLSDPYEVLKDDEFAAAEITRLHELRLQAIELRAESMLHVGRARECVAELEWAARTFPLRESLSSLLALARQETGSHAEALRSLRCTERALAELGLEPSPALRELEQRILTHQRALDRFRPDDRRDDRRANGRIDGQTSGRMSVGGRPHGATSRPACWL